MSGHQHAWWDWTRALTLLYLSSFVVASAVFGGMLQGLILAALALPLIAIATGFWSHAVPVSFKTIILAAASCGGLAVRFHFFPDPWHLKTWYLAAGGSWLLFVIIAFEGRAPSPAQEKPSWQPFVTISLPLAFTGGILYYLFFR